MNKNDLIAYLKVNNIWAKRAMGQNFLVDDQVLTDIIHAAEIKPDDTILEIGPGLGFLTAELIKTAGKVIAVEKDDVLSQKLEIKSQNCKSKLKIINADVLDLSAYGLQLTAYDYKLVANIPYNITSLIIRKFLEEKNPPEMMVLMVQKEVAERICAQPRSTSSGQAGGMSLLSLSVQFYAEPEIIRIVPKESFFPVPNVDSAVIKLKVKSEKLKVNSKDFFRLAKFGFSSRRKTLENNLAAGFHIEKRLASDIIKEAGLDAKIRAQDLSLEDWVNLYQVTEKFKVQLKTD